MNKPLRNMMAIALLLAMGTLVSAHRAAAADPKPALTIAFAGYDQLIERSQGPGRAQRPHEVGGQGRSQYRIADARQGSGRIGQVASLGRIGFPGRERSADRARLSSRHRSEETACFASRAGRRTPAPTPKASTNIPHGRQDGLCQAKGQVGRLLGQRGNAGQRPGRPRSGIRRSDEEVSPLRPRFRAERPRGQPRECPQEPPRHRGIHARHAAEPAPRSSGR